MVQQVRQRQQKIVSYVASSEEDEDMSRGMIYREVYLTLAGTLTVTAGNNTAAKTKRGDEWAVVKKVEIIANNTDVIKSIDGPALYMLNYFLYGTWPQVTALLGDGATANPAFKSTLILPFWMPRSIRPLDTALDSRRLSDLKVKITWGTHTDINGDASGFTVAPSVTVDSLESFNLPVDSEFSQWRIFKQEVTNTATNAAFQIKQDVGKMFRGFMINTTRDGADVSDILNKFTWQSGTTIFAQRNANVMQQVHRIRNTLEYSTASPQKGTTFNKLGGWYFYDHVTDGMNTECIDTLGLSEHELELDVTYTSGAEIIRIYPMQLIPVRKAAA